MLGFSSVGFRGTTLRSFFFGGGVVLFCVWEDVQNSVILAVVSVQFFTLDSPRMLYMRLVFSHSKGLDCSTFFFNRQKLFILLLVCLNHLYIISGSLSI